MQSYMISALLGAYNSMQMCRVASCPTDKELCTGNMATLSSLILKLEAPVIRDYPWRWRMDARSSCITVSWHERLLRGLVNADKLTSAGAKRRARGCVVNQPSLSKHRSQAADEVPSGLEGVEQPLKSTCPECEEARRGGWRGQRS